MDYNLDIKSYLATNNRYYQKLTLTDKNRFISRVQFFISHKSITGKQGFIVTDAVKLQIAASATQVTFGLEIWDYSHFNQIFIFPSEYKNPQTGKLHKGETNLGGFMCFSWKDFIAGNEKQEDKINLGFHEFAHALRFNGIRGAHTDYFFENYFKRWLACAVKEYSKMRNGLPSIFRKYGAVNINEFFSVVVETFFESPQEFKAYFPQLYLQTSILLNQTFLKDGFLQINCRNLLMKNEELKLVLAESAPFRYHLKNNESMIMALLFAMIGFFSLLDQGYLYPPPYILFGIAVLCWLNLEKKYTRVVFDQSTVKIYKGYLFFNKFWCKTIPLSQLIALFFQYENTSDNESNIKQINFAQITYYVNDFFYEDDLYVTIDEKQLNELKQELVKNYIHVFIKN